MVTNTLLDIDMITQEALIVLQNEVILASRVKRDYDDQYAKSGAKIGNAIRVRKPVRYNVTSGPAASAQNTVETFVPLVLTSQKHVDVEYTTEELALDLDAFSDRIVKPAIGQLSSTIDQDGFATATGQTISGSGIYDGNYPGVEWLSTPGVLSPTTGPASWNGSAPNTLLTYLEAGARLDEAGAPQEDGKRHIITSPRSNVAIVDVLKTLFQSGAEIAEQYRKGVMGVAAGFMWAKSNNVARFTNSVTDGAGAVATTSVSGATTLAVKSFGAADTFLKGTQFVVAGVHAVNPQSRASTGVLQVFTVTQNGTNDGSGNFTLNVYPTIINSGQNQTVDTLPQLDAVITVMGASAAQTDVNLAFHEDAFALGMADLADVSGQGAECRRISDKNGGFSIRYVSQYNAQTDAVIRRFDVLYGWQVIRPELGVRVQG